VGSPRDHIPIALTIREKPRITATAFKGRGTVGAELGLKTKLQLSTAKLDWVTQVDQFKRSAGVNTELNGQPHVPFTSAGALPTWLQHCCRAPPTLSVQPVKEMATLFRTLIACIEQIRTKEAPADLRDMLRTLETAAYRKCRGRRRIGCAARRDEVIVC
jgi:hypothetical protein